MGVELAVSKKKPSFKAHLPSLTSPCWHLQGALLSSTHRKYRKSTQLPFQKQLGPADSIHRSLQSSGWIPSANSDFWAGNWVEKNPHKRPTMSKAKIWTSSCFENFLLGEGTSSFCWEPPTGCSGSTVIPLLQPLRPIDSPRSSHPCLSWRIFVSFGRSKPQAFHKWRATRTASDPLDVDLYKMAIFGGCLWSMVHLMTISWLIFWRTWVSHWSLKTATHPKN